MKYPEPFQISYHRYRQFFQNVSANGYEDGRDELVLLVSHRKSVQSILEMFDKNARIKDVVGVPYCSLSILQREDQS
jgi:hypothetical protein